MQTRSSWRPKRPRWTWPTLEKAAEEAPIIKLVNLILTDAVKRGASDIHVEPYEKELSRPVPH